jgi:hypothetical protein
MGIAQVQNGLRICLTSATGVQAIETDDCVLDIGADGTAVQAEITAVNFNLKKRGAIANLPPALIIDNQAGCRYDSRADAMVIAFASNVAARGPLSHRVDVPCRILLDSRNSLCGAEIDVPREDAQRVVAQYAKA